jgi:hypothetical protein
MGSPPASSGLRHNKKKTPRGTWTGVQWRILDWGAVPKGGGGTGKTDGGLESYRWPARVWRSRDGRRVAIPRGVESIARHQHSKRQPWGRRELAASPLSPSRRRHGEGGKRKKNKI